MATTLLFKAQAQPPVLTQQTAHLGQQAHCLAPLTGSALLMVTDTLSRLHKAQPPVRTQPMEPRGQQAQCQVVLTGAA